MTDGSTQLTESDYKYLDQIDQVIDLSISQDNPNIALDWGSDLIHAMQLGGLTLSKYLWEMNNLWGDAFPSDSTFAEIAETRLGVAPSTFNRYINLWEWLRKHPNLQGKPIKGLLLCTAAMREQQITDDDMDKLEKATSHGEIHEIIRRVRGHKTKSKSALYMRLLNDGTLQARFGGDDYYSNVGYIAKAELGGKMRADGALFDAVRSRLESAGVVVEA